MKTKGLPPKIHEKGSSYYYVNRVGKKVVWTFLCSAAEGRHALDAKLWELEHGNKPAHQRTLYDAINRWKEKYVKLHGEGNFRDELNMLEVFANSDEIRPYSLQEIESEHISNFLEHWEEDGHYRMFNRYHSLIGQVFNEAARKGWRKVKIAEGYSVTTPNPCDGITRYPNNVRDRYITDDEMDKIKVALTYFKNDRLNSIKLTSKTMVAIVEMAYLTAQRRKDILGLQWQQIKPLEGCIWFKPTKTAQTTGAAVAISITPRLQQLLNELKTDPPQDIGLVFTNIFGDPISPSGFDSAWRRAVNLIDWKKLGVTRPTFRDLRRKAITDIVRKSGWEEGRKIACHASVQMTQKYVSSCIDFAAEKCSATA